MNTLQMVAFRGYSWRVYYGYGDKLNELRMDIGTVEHKLPELLLIYCLHLWLEYHLYLIVQVNKPTHILSKVNKTSLKNNNISLNNNNICPL